MKKKQFKFKGVVLACCLAASMPLGATIPFEISAMADTGTQKPKQQEKQQPQNRSSRRNSNNLKNRNNRISSNNNHKTDKIRKKSLQMS